MTHLTPDENCNATVYYDDGSTVNIFATKIRLMDLDYFENWKCKAGVERIVILPDSSVFGGECENDYLGNLTNGSFNLIDNFTTCKQNRCGNNPDDIMMEKYLPNANDNN